MTKFRTILFLPIPKSATVNIGLLLFRLLFGLSLAINHGWPTIKGIFNEKVNYPDPLGIGLFLSMTLMGFAEFVCALLVVLGLFSRIAALTVVIGFSVAFFVVHSGDPFSAREMAYLYGIAFIGLAITGPGKYSADAFLYN